MSSNSCLRLRRPLSDSENQVLVLIACRRCKGLFSLCRSCFSGQAYCSEECRRPAQRTAAIERRKRYRATLRARRSRAAQAARRRERKKVGHAGSAALVVVHCGLEPAAMAVAELACSHEPEVPYASRSVESPASAASQPPSSVDPPQSSTVWRCVGCGCLSAHVVSVREYRDQAEVVRTLRLARGRAPRQHRGPPDQRGGH